jgi:hypothetical protein
MNSQFKNGIQIDVVLSTKGKKKKVRKSAYIRELGGKDV